MEIERKYLIKKLPEDLAQYPYMEMEQAYLCTEPVVRVRKEGEDYVLTYKSNGDHINPLSHPGEERTDD